MYSRDPSWTLPLTKFGPWGPTSGCKITYDSAKKTNTASDKYPQGMCSLKVVAKAATPAWWTKDPSEYIRVFLRGTLNQQHTCCSGTAPT
jgi:hypothetical protein